MKTLNLFLCLALTACGTLELEFESSSGDHPQGTTTTTPKAPPTAATEEPTPEPSSSSWFPPQAEGFELVGFVGGTTQAVAVQGKYAYIGVGPRLVIVDISDPANPRPVGQQMADALLPVHSNIRSIRPMGDHALVGHSGVGLWVFEIFNPTAADVRVMDYTGNVQDIAVVGNLAYITDSLSGMRTLELKNPEPYIEVGTFFEPSDFETLEGIAIEVAGDYAYLGVSEKLSIIDVSDPANPVEAGSFPLPRNYVSEVRVDGDQAYVLTSDAFRILDVSEPTSPYEVGHFPLPCISEQPCGNEALVIEGNYAYLAARGIGLWVIDISDPAAPIEIGSHDTPGEAVDIAVAGNYAYVADLTHGLRVIDISDAAKPEEVGSFEPLQIASDGVQDRDLLYVPAGSKGLQIFDFTHPLEPNLTGIIDTPGEAIDVALAGRYAYVAGRDGGLQVVDVSDPASPFVAATLDDIGWVEALAVAGDFAYLSATSTPEGRNGILVLDISSPLEPRPIGFEKNEPGASALVLAGRHLFLPAADGGLRVMDVSDPVEPDLVATYLSGEWVTGIVTREPYAFVTSITGLKIFDMTDPANMEKLADYDAPYAGGIHLAGRYAYLSSENGLQKLDISNPTQPRQVAYYRAMWGGQILSFKDLIYWNGLLLQEDNR